MKPLTIYIAGPMRGIPFYNFPAFDAARDMLYCIHPGATILSPADMDREAKFDAMKCPADTDWNAIPPRFDFLECVRRDLDAVRSCTMIYMLAGWEKSSGARAEKAVAEWMGATIIYEIPFVTSTELIVVDPNTGARKGSKIERFDLIPADILLELAAHFGQGAQKYEDRNWQKGYRWGLSFAAAMRHAWQFWNGEDRDQQTNSKHVVAAAWHLLALAWFMDHHRQGDDRKLLPTVTRCDTV
jgi:hypothetical protein